MTVPRPRSPDVGAPSASDATAAAHAAGLRHVDDGRPGLRRRSVGRVRQGQRIVPVFVIEDETGRRVKHPTTLERIRQLAVPPAWRQVWICPDPKGHIQATGRDARGRKQYRYHLRWRQERDSTKYSRLLAFGRALPALRRRVSADLDGLGLSRRKVVATVVRLLETTFIRVGNEEYARSNHSFGLTTLKDRHVGFRAKGMLFHFRGKSGVEHDVAVHDAKLARIVRRCRDLPGQELFQYVADDGRRAAINSADVNAYIREATGDDFTAKDFRTWAGTILAALALQEIAAAANPSRARRPSNRDVARAIKRVAVRLGNTPSVCRKCYVHPAVIASYLDGTLTAAFARRGVAKASGRRAGLRPEEAVVLDLLQGPRGARRAREGARLRLVG